jgi:membrane protein YqaA with SNARE-associated domain
MKFLYKYICKLVHYPAATWLFAGLVTIEGIIIIPTTTMLTIFCLERQKNSWWYATVATVATACAALLGYYVGAFLWELLNGFIFRYVIAPESFYKCVHIYQKNHVSIAFLYSLIPLPFQALTMSAGFCSVSLAPFVAATVAGRGVRFYTVALITWLYGDSLQQIIDRYFYYFVVLFKVLLVTSWWIIQ